MRLLPMLACTSAIALLGITSGCGGVEEEQPLPENVTNFQKLFADNCAGCHGPEGKQGAGPQLNDPLYQAVVNKDQLKDVISKGRTGTPMPAFAKSAGGTLTDKQIDILAGEMQKNWGKPEQFTGVALPSYAADGPGNIANGATVFRIKCLACHGVEGRGGTIAGAVNDPSYLAITSDQLLRTTVIIGRPVSGMPNYDRKGKPMTSQEITDVVAWLASHRTPPAELSAGGSAPVAGTPAPPNSPAPAAKGANQK